MGWGMGVGGEVGAEGGDELLLLQFEVLHDYNSKNADNFY